VALVDEAFIPEALDDPPDGLHVVGVHGLVVVVKVYPAAGAGHDAAPLVGIPEYYGAAGLIEVGHAVVLDSLLAGYAQLLFHLVLDGEAVAVPAEAALYLEALHCLVAGNDVFYGSGDEMAEVGQTGGEGRAVVEDVFGCSIALGY